MTIAPLSSDTTAAVAELQFAAWRAMSPATKLAQVRDITRTGLILERAGVQLRYPHLSEEATFRLLAARRLGEALATRVYGPPGAGS